MAKEFLAAQDPADPGVLMLSQFAGAAKELDEALIVNPHETDAVAAALKRALEMPVDERRDRHAPMLAHLLKNDIGRWARSYTSTLLDGRTGRGLLEVIRSLLKPLAAQTPRGSLGSVEPIGGDIWRSTNATIRPRDNAHLMSPSKNPCLSAMGGGARTPPSG